MRVLVRMNMKRRKMILDSGKDGGFFFVTMPPPMAPIMPQKEDCARRRVQVNAVGYHGKRRCVQGELYITTFTHDCGLPIREIVPVLTRWSTLCAISKPGGRI